MKYDYQIGDIVTRPLEESGSRYAVLDVRGRYLMVSTSAGPCLVSVDECEPLRPDPRRFIRGESVN